MHKNGLRNHHNMQCPNDADPITKAFRRATGAVHGVNPAHHCNLQTCTYWQLPNKHVYVCTASMHVHTCSDRSCTIAVVSHYDASNTGFRVCPISGLEMRDVDYVSAETIKVKDRWLKAGNTIGTAKRITRKNLHAPRVITTLTVRAIVRSIVLVATVQPPNTIARIVRRLSTRKPFGELVTDVINAAGFDMQSDAPDKLVASIARYCEYVRPFLDIVPSTLTLVAVVVSLLATGLKANGVVVFKQDKWLQSNTPQLTAYARVPHLQCRAMSACTRSLKRVVFKGGVICAAFVFPGAMG